MIHRYGFPHPLTLAPAFASPGTRVVGLGSSAPTGWRGWLLAAGEDDTVVVHRRRPAGPDDGGPRERADAPERQREAGGPAPSSGGGRPARSTGFSGGSSDGSGGGAGGGFQLPTGLPKGRLGCAIVAIGALLIVCLVAFLLMQSNSPAQPESAPTQQPAAPVATQPLATQAPRPTPLPTLALAPAAATQASPVSQAPAAAPAQAPASSVKPGQKWTVLLYQDADDKVLADDIYFDLNEAERTGSTDRVNVIAQLARYRGSAKATDNWVGAKRFYVTRDSDLHKINSKELANLGTVDMSNPQTLVDFATWAIQAYPADKYVLILSDHGMGWPGGFTAASAKPRTLPNVPMAQAVDGQIFLNELDNALGLIRQRAGVDKFELVGLDACLMSQLEVYSALAPHARFAVASEETEPALGWAYTAFLETLTKNPDVTGAELGRTIVQTYISQDERIIDDQARTEYMRKGSPMGGFFDSVGAPGSDQLAREMGDSITLTALDLAALPALLQSVNQFAYALQGAQPAAVDQARAYAQSYTSIFGDQVPPSYIDLGHFAALAARTTNSPEVTQAAANVQNAIKTAVLAEKHGPKKPGSTGIAIYFPNSQLYRSPIAGPASYNVVAQRFASQSSWPNFLAFHYTGKKFAASAAGQPAIPDRTTPITAPGAGRIQVSPVRLTSNTVKIRNTITMRADVTGDNVGYVYFFTGYLDKKNLSINVADTDYLDSPQSRQLNGVTYPDWSGKAKFTLAFDWEPLMFSISDGEKSAQVLLTPQSYGDAPEKAVYTTDGIYTFATSGETNYARLFFSNGLLRQVIGFAGAKLDGTGPAHEIIPQTGDRFTVLEKWLDLDATGQIQKTATQKGATLTFGAKTFTWKQLDAAAGTYVVGFIVADLDGNTTRSYAQVTVQ